MKLACLAFVYALSLVTTAVAQLDTEFTYQGELNVNGSPANGAFNLGFSLWNAETGGNVVSGFSLHPAVPVIDGRFSVAIDLGAEVFGVYNEDRWLRVSVNGVALTPRQPVTRSPYAIQTRGIVVSDSGKVGIGTSTPLQTLHVRQQTSSKGIRIENNTTTDFWENGIGLTTQSYMFWYNGVNKARISSIDGSYIQVSDRRLKRDIQDLPAVLDRVSQLEPNSYLYLDNPEYGPRSIGFIAQDVEELFPDLVRESDEGYKGLAYDGFAVISIKAIQELKTQLEAEISVLRNENEELRKRLNSLEQRIE